jgi:tetratricopeptide (TPR) repeat protein
MISTSLVVDDKLTDEYHNLGVLYRDQGKLAEAQAMYERALAGYEKAVGPDHPRSQSL